MKTNVLAAAFAAMLSSGAAVAADLPTQAPPPSMPMAVSPWDFEVAGGLTTDYIFRGISQSNHALSVFARGELRYNINDMWQVYASVAGASIKFTKFDPSPSMELDLFGGVRGTFGNFTTDFGVIGYIYPGLNAPTPNGIFVSQVHFWEAYAKFGYAFNSTFSIGANYFYTPSYLNTGADGHYLSGTVKVALPADFSISGEFGRQWLGTTDVAHAAYKMPDYNYWNLGLSYSYKFVTFDVRYHDTDMSPNKCFLITGPTDTLAGTRSNYCDQRFVGSISFALTSKDVASLPGSAPVVAKY